MVIVIVGEKRFEVDEGKLRVSEYYSGLLNIFNCNSVPALVINDREHVVIDYVKFLLGETINTCLRDNLEYCFYIGDRNYLKHLVNVLLQDYKGNKAVIPELHPDLQRDIYSLFPLSSVPDKFVNKTSFLDLWLEGKEKYGAMIVDKRKCQYEINHYSSQDDQNDHSDQIISISYKSYKEGDDKYYLGSTNIQYCTNKKKVDIYISPMLYSKYFVIGDLVMEFTDNNHLSSLTSDGVPSRSTSKDVTEYKDYFTPSPLNDVKRISMNRKKDNDKNRVKLFLNE